jgi:phosphatidylglycerophosphatase A
MKFIFPRIIAGGFGSGFVPTAPGTVGSAAAAVVLFLVKGYGDMGAKGDLLLALALIILGLITVTLSLKHSESKDPGWIVIDEWAGMALATWGIGPNLFLFFCAFVLFRIFDVLKPPPIRWLETLPGAWGVMADDLAAGMVARILLAGIVYLY